MHVHSYITNSTSKTTQIASKYMDLFNHPYFNHGSINLMYALQLQRAIYYQFVNIYTYLCQGLLIVRPDWSYALWSEIRLDTKHWSNSHVMNWCDTAVNTALGKIVIIFFSKLCQLANILILKNPNFGETDKFEKTFLIIFPV